MFRWKWVLWNPWSQIWTLGSARSFVQGFIYYWQWHFWHLGLDWQRLENLKNKFLWFSIKPLILQKINIKSLILPKGYKLSQIKKTNFITLYSLISVIMCNYTLFQSLFRRIEWNKNCIWHFPTSKGASSKERTEAMKNAQSFIKTKSYPQYTQAKFL